MYGLTAFGSTFSMFMIQHLGEFFNKFWSDNVIFTIGDEELNVRVADSFLTRFAGLMLRGRLKAGRGLLIAPCSSIHMCFMRFAIDAVFIDREYRVLKISRHLLPWLGLAWRPGAWGVIELTAGEADRLGIREGSQLVRQ